MSISINELLTTILVIVTSFYAWATFRILKANEKVVDVMSKQNEALIRPYITITPLVNPRHPIIYLKIINTGKTAAVDVKLEIDRPFYQFGEGREEKNIATFSAFQKPIDCFPPGMSLCFDLAQGFVIFGKDANPNITPVKFSIKAIYSYGERTVEEVTNVDLQPYLNSRSEPEPKIEELEKIRKAIEGLNKK